ncbi:chloride channel protein [Leucobacter sp. HY1910]
MNDRYAGVKLIRGLTHTLLGGIVGGVLGAAFVVGVTSLIKLLLDLVSRQDNWVTLAAPFAGVTVSALLLYLFAQGRAKQQLVEHELAPQGFMAWLRAPSNALRADLTGDVVRAAGHEERFPWQLAPLRALAIIFTVGSGAPMGTESPAAHLGVAAGASLGGWGKRLADLARPAAISGGAAGVAALMGLPLVGLVFMLELGRRNSAPVSVLRAIAAGLGATIGWAANASLHLDFIRLIAPLAGPQGPGQALLIALLVGTGSGVFGAVMGAGIYRARRWSSKPLLKVLLGGLALFCCIILIRIIAGPGAALGPGGGAISWAEGAEASLWVLLLVAALRAVATIATVAAGGVGGLFVPLLAVGDLVGRAFAPTLAAASTLAASAGLPGRLRAGIGCRSRQWGWCFRWEGRSVRASQV